LRELRELTRTRVVLVAQRTRWKNRITATLAKWGWPASEYSDPYGKKAREELQTRLEGLLEPTRWATQQMLLQLDSLSAQIREFEKLLEELVEITPAMQWLETLPGVGVIFSATMALEIGEIGRFFERRAAGVVLGNGTASACQRRSRALWPDASGCESLFEMGLRKRRIRRR
jgi:transposase